MDQQDQAQKPVYSTSQEAREAYRARRGQTNDAKNPVVAARFPLRGDNADDLRARAYRWFFGNGGQTSGPYGSHPTK